MDFKKLYTNVFNEVKLIITEPRKHWQTLKEREATGFMMLNQLLLPSMVLVFIAAFLGESLFNSEYGILLIDGLVRASRKVLAIILSYYVSIWIVYETARNYKARPDFEDARKIAFYSIVPAIVSSIVVGLLPFIEIFDLFSLYGLFVAWEGIHVLFDVPDRKTNQVSILIISMMFLSIIVINILLLKVATLFVF